LELRFTTLDYDHVWILIKGYINQICGENPTDLRMGVPAPTTNFDGLSITLIEMQRKAAIISTYQTCQDARALEGWLEARPQRFAMVGINANSYNAIVWIASQSYGPLNILWVSRK
jgi:hypothetical protein